MTANITIDTFSQIPACYIYNSSIRRLAPDVSYRGFNIRMHKIVGYGGSFFVEPDAEHDDTHSEFVEYANFASTLGTQPVVHTIHMRNEKNRLGTAGAFTLAYHVDDWLEFCGTAKAKIDAWHASRAV